MSFILKACLCADYVFNLKEMVRVDLNWYIGSFLPFSTSVVPSLLFATHSVMIIDVHERLSYKGIDCVIRISSLPTVSFTLILKSLFVLIEGLKNEITSGNHGS